MPIFGGGLPDNPEDFKATLAEHFDEFRTRILWSSGFLVLGTFVGWFLYPVVSALMQGVTSKAISTSPRHITMMYLGGFPAPFMLHFKMSLYIGLVIAVPLIVHQIWLFVRPGLRPSERKPFLVVVPISLALFFLGVAVGWITLAPTLQWFLSFQNETPQWGIIQDPFELLLFGLKLMLVFGLSFQLPLIVYFLAAVGIISPDFLWRYWRHSTAGIFLTAAIVTPSGDPFTMMALAIPLSVLFFGSILAAKISFRNRKTHDELDHLD